MQQQFGSLLLGAAMSPLLTAPTVPVILGDIGTHGVPGILPLAKIGEFLPQPTWLWLLIAVAVLAVLWLLHRLRVMQIADRIRTRVDARARERERIVRGLHDTLLQDLQGLILRFQAISERIPAGQGARAGLEAALLAADDVMTQAREQAHALRLEDLSDLCAALAEIVAATPFDPPIQVRLTVEGRTRPLKPLVALEISRIVREALFNIAQHAHAPAAGIAVGFEAGYLAVRVHDDGVGIAADALGRCESEGHGGMIGMRERAERIGGTLTISSGPDEGSEITLTLPARLAFATRNPPRTCRSRCLGSFRRMDRP
jgi:signal transduction histidine kinase